MVEPLLVILPDNTPFVWSSACEQAFRELKQALTTAPVLAYPDYTRPFILCTDASQVAIGAVLEQVGTSGFRHPVAYLSRTLNVTQRKYTVSEKECLALVKAIRHFRQFLTFGHFLVYTDHKALQALVNPKSKVAEGRLQRWQLFLQSYDFTVYHQSGPLNVVADSLSRLHGQPPQFLILLLLLLFHFLLPSQLVSCKSVPFRSRKDLPFCNAFARRNNMI